MFERSAIEIAPLAYMRGRTLNHAFIILDEAQNTTPEQMKMFLTRIGFGTKAVVTGDVTQIDLPRGQKSGLIEARARPRTTCAASPSPISQPTTWCAIRWCSASSMPTSATPNETPRENAAAVTAAIRLELAVQYAAAQRRAAVRRPAAPLGARRAGAATPRVTLRIVGAAPKAAGSIALPRTRTTRPTC